MMKHHREQSISSKKEIARQETLQKRQTEIDLILAQENQILEDYKQGQPFSRLQWQDAPRFPPSEMQALSNVITEYFLEKYDIHCKVLVARDRPCEIDFSNPKCTCILS